MPGCLPLIAAILMQKFLGSVKLTCPEKQSLIRRRLENWKHEDLAYQGYTYSLESNQPLASPNFISQQLAMWPSRVHTPSLAEPSPPNTSTLPLFWPVVQLYAKNPRGPKKIMFFLRTTANYILQFIHQYFQEENG